MNSVNRERRGLLLSLTSFNNPRSKLCPKSGGGRAILPAIALALLYALPGTARANALNPTNFTSLGALTLATNATASTARYTINTSGEIPSLLDSASNTLYSGVIYNQGGTFDSNIAVFDFSSISIGAGVTITITGSNPVALLSLTSIDIAGTMDANGTNGGNQGDGFPGPGGPGGGAGGAGSGGSGQGPGGAEGGFDGLGNGSWGDGGSFGGQGAAWDPYLIPAPTYGDLRAFLQGGSGGGASGANLFGSGAGGGGGGGGVELGAAVSITLEDTANIMAMGGLGGGGSAINTGGGSGGGVFIHAPAVTLETNPNDFDQFAQVNASGDGGGRIAFLTQSGAVTGDTNGVIVGSSTYGNPGVITYGVLFQVFIYGQPQSVATYTGNTVNLAASGINGAPPFTFQWQFDGLNLSDGGSIFGSQTAGLTIANATTADSGTYQLLVTNPAGTVSSSNATVTVVNPVPGSYESAVLAVNPFAFWKLNETSNPSLGGVLAYDYVGGHNGTYQTNAQNGFNGILGPEAPAFLGFPAINSALGTFSNTPNCYVSASAGSLIATNLTYAMWIKPSGPVENWAGLLMDRGGAGEGFGFGGTTDSTGMSELAYTWNSNSTYTFNSNLFPPSNQWSFVALTIAPTQATIYLINTNGVQTAVNAIAHRVFCFETLMSEGG
jgi:hypothetical protein